MDVGTTLRTAREQRNLPLSRLAATTKIPAAVLHAIEANDFERVPRGIFARGFIRAYAREVGLDPEAIVEQYRAETSPATPPGEGAPDLAPAEVIDDRQIDPDLSPSGPGLGYLLIVTALLAGVVSFNRGTGDAPAPAPVPAEETVAAVPLPPVQPAALSLGEAQPVATSGEGLRMDLRAEGLCWVEAVVDGRTLVYRLMQPGEHETIDAEREIVLRVGDPGAVSYTVNGRPGDPFGRAGVPITVRITPDAMQPLPGRPATEAL